MKIFIHGGFVVDPANAVFSKQDVFIDGGKIAPLPADPGSADLVIDAAGKIVSPGFIDIHMHEDPVKDGRIVLDEETSIFSCMLRMGVTTAVGGNCGENKYHPADYLDLADRDGTPCNVAMLAGHEFFRDAAGCTDKYGPTTAQQRAWMAQEMEKCLDRGCAGISFGIRYVPGMDAKELVETAAGCKKYGRMIAAHIRSDAAEVFDAAREFLDAGVALGVPIQVSHIGSMAGFGQMKEFLTLVDAYRRRHPRIYCDCYPYAAFSTSIGSATYDEGWLERYHCGYDVVELSEGKYKGQRCTKETFDETRRDFPGCTTVCYVMQQEDVDLAYRHPGVMLASDGVLSGGQGHPRAAGAFPRLLAAYVRQGKLGLYDAINRMTAMPAAQLGFQNKGRLSIGADADLVIFDLENIQDCASFQQPLLPPTGIDWVLVNGVPAVREGRIINGRAGFSVRPVK